MLGSETPRELGCMTIVVHASVMQCRRWRIQLLLIHPILTVCESLTVDLLSTF